MRTPLGTVIFFLKQILEIMDKETLPQSFHNKVARYFSFMESQLELTLTFVEDMLDINQMREGVFHLQKNGLIWEKKKFDPNELLKLIHAIFRPQAKDRGIELKTSVVEYLSPPSDRDNNNEHMLLNDEQR